MCIINYVYILIDIYRVVQNHIHIRWGFWCGGRSRNSTISLTSSRTRSRNVVIWAPSLASCSMCLLIFFLRSLIPSSLVAATIFDSHTCNKIVFVWNHTWLARTWLTWRARYHTNCSQLFWDVLHTIISFGDHAS